MESELHFVPGLLYHPRGDPSHSFLYKCQVLVIVMCVEQQMPSVQLHRHTPHTPHITMLAPFHAPQNHLWSSVLPRSYDCGLAPFRDVGNIPEIDQFYGVIDALLERIRPEKRVFGLEVSVHQVKRVQEPYGLKELSENRLKNLCGVAYLAVGKKGN